MNDNEDFSSWDPYRQHYEIDQAFVTALIEFQLDLAESKLLDSDEYPDADNIIKRIQNNVR